MKGHRLFIAISIPADIQRRLLAAIDEWHDLPIRWTKQKNIHITLLFIGSVGDEELSRIVSVLPLATQGIQLFDIEFSHIGVGPSEKNPRMVWAEGTTSSGLVKLQKQIEDVIFEDKGYVNDDDVRGESFNTTKNKSFRLHVTLGRMIPFRWKNLAPKIHIAKSISTSFPVASIELMESELGPGGPVYTILSSAELE